MLISLKSEENEIVKAYYVEFKLNGELHSKYFTGRNVSEVKRTIENIYGEVKYKLIQEL